VTYACGDVKAKNKPIYEWGWPVSKSTCELYTSRTQVPTVRLR
jgi:hypothetical protein